MNFCLVILLNYQEQNFQFNQDKMNFSTPRNILGSICSTKTAYGIQSNAAGSAPSISSKLKPFSGYLRNNDEAIGFEDIFNDMSQRELMGELHLMMEYKLDFL